MNTDIHRLLDEAFAGIEMTPAAQDLKEEIRANLAAQVDELVAAGASPAEAARKAVADLGDVRALLEDDPSAGPAHAPGWEALTARNRVRPKPGFVVRAVLLSLVAAAALVGILLVVLLMQPAAPLSVAGLGAVVAVALGIVTTDALLQETTTNHPLPAARAVGFGLATGGTLLALGLGGAFALALDQLWLVILAAVLLVGSIALFSYLGATQTNRHKAWTRGAMMQMPPNRFETDPESAARFGIYTAAIWFLTLAVIVVLVFTVGWWWAPVAFVGGLAAMMLLLARMLYAPRSGDHR
ncbi:permease prefix domain 1-containing protein [Microbacterium sp. Au-Mic1]|uniref:permease prefix domain 1-containing protein n=1 Tax=Microbacterium sp. Au-Mic1 TaxID=2906457 RepID=UPI001E4DAA1E|nr:permease prefix domain 1-containing protein [Microbacterium sp. Au-Mic1]MCE4026624.1 permease prefix domain 1-containing protein [Microbacterium sp. Au-Mic1]